MNINTDRLTAEADQHVTANRQARCCDAFEPCDRCRRGRVNAVARRHVVRVELAR